MLRLAHVAPDLGDLDFCYRATSSDPYIGPVLGGAGSPKEAGAPQDASSPKDAGAEAPTDAATDADAPDATDASDAAAVSDAALDATIADAGADANQALDAAAGDAGKQVFLPYLSMTGYVALQGSGTFEIAIVDASSQGCSTPRLVGQVTLDAGRRSTLALMGREDVDASTGGAGGGTELALIAFTDDPTPDPTKTRVRLLHAAIGSPKRAPESTLSASFVVGAATSDIPIARKIEPRHVAAASTIEPSVDPLGYHADMPLSTPARMRISRSLDAGGTTWTSAAAPLGLRAGSIHTGIIVNDDASDLVILWCTDENTPSTETSCTLLRP